MKVLWTESALLQIESIRDFISLSSAEYAYQLAERF